MSKVYGAVGETVRSPFSARGLPLLSVQLVALEDDHETVADSPGVIAGRSVERAMVVAFWKFLSSVPSLGESKAMSDRS